MDIITIIIREAEPQLSLAIRYVGELVVNAKVVYVSPDYDSKDGAYNETVNYLSTNKPRLMNQL